MKITTILEKWFVRIKVANFILEIFYTIFVLIGVERNAVCLKKKKMQKKKKATSFKIKLF
jgi:hypothetical protein